MRLNDVAYLRSGDKGDVSNVAVLAHTEDGFRLLDRTLTAERVAEFMGDIVDGEVTVYPLPKLLAFNVVMRNALGGGATSTLRIDQTGKSIGAVLSRMDLPGVSQRDFNGDGDDWVPIFV